MEKKTKDKIDKRLEVLPKHHIDSCIFLESHDKEETRQCIRYLNKVGYNYRGVVPFPVLSEMFFIALHLDNYDKRIKFIDLFKDTLEAQRIEISRPMQFEKTSLEIKKLDSFLEHDITDRHVLASAIEDKAYILVTTDKKLIKNSVLEKRFNINIRHPKDLL
ncbi:MAG: type II toxin-antitoxin system VapC family toxin [Candidatus Aenigmatarchaeota archaeon]